MYSKRAVRTNQINMWYLNGWASLDMLVKREDHSKYQFLAPSNLYKDWATNPRGTSTTSSALESRSSRICHLPPTFVYADYVGHLNFLHCTFGSICTASVYMFVWLSEYLTDYRYTRSNIFFSQNNNLFINSGHHN